MDRLTYYNERYKKWCLPQGKGVWRKIVDTVKAYEDTGLTPEEIIALKEKCRLLEQATEGDVCTSTQQDDYSKYHRKNQGV